MKTLKELIEEANKISNEDGTASDLGVAPTGHIIKDKKEEEDNDSTWLPL